MQYFGGKISKSLPLVDTLGGDEFVTGRRLFGSSLYVITEGSLAGRPAIPKWNHAGTGKEPRYYSVQDFYWLYRLLAHGQEKYQQDGRGEIPRIHRCLNHLHEVHALLLQPTDAYQVEFVKSLIREEVVEIISALNPDATDEKKQKAMWQAVQVATGEDRLKRFNPGAFAARIVSAINDVVARETAAMSIDARYAFWRRVTQSVLATLEFQVDTHAQFQERLLTNWDENIQRYTPAITYRLERYAADLRTYDLEPFRTTFLYVANEFEQAVQCIRRKEYSAANKLLQTALASLWLRRVRVEVERALFAVSRKVHFPIVTFNTPQVLSALQTSKEQVSRLRTENMRAFDVKTVKAGLDDAIRALQSSNTDYVVAHDRLRETAKLI